MKMKLIHRQVCFYGGVLEIKRPELGIVGRGTTFEQLEASVRAYRVANAIPNGLGLDEEIEQCVCEVQPDACTDVDPESLVIRRTLNLEDVVTGTKTMVSFLAAGSPLVDRPEAERRAEICSRCKWNQAFSKPCSGICGSLKDVVTGIIGSQGTTRDNVIMSCYWCGCFLQAAVWVPREIQWNALSQSQKRKFAQVEHCWKRPPETA